MSLLSTAKLVRIYWSVRSSGPNKTSYSTIIREYIQLLNRFNHNKHLLLGEALARDYTSWRNLFSTSLPVALQIPSPGVYNYVSIAERFYGLLELSNRCRFDDECCLDQRRQWNAQQPAAERPRQEKKGSSLSNKLTKNDFTTLIYYLWRRKNLASGMWAILVIFCLCWLPYQTYLMYQAFQTEENATTKRIYMCVYWLAIANAAVNPLLFYRLDKQ